MKHGCMVMTLRLSSSRHSKSRQIHRGRKKRIKFAAMSSPCRSFFSTSKELSTRNSYPWSNRQWQVLLWGFEVAEGGHSAQTSRQVEEQQLVSPPWQRARSHITRYSTIPDFYGWKGVILTRLRRSMQNRKRLLTHTVETRSYGKKLFNGQISRRFG
jgi:hypothetical protein